MLAFYNLNNDLLRAEKNVISYMQYVVKIICTNYCYLFSVYEYMLSYLVNIFYGNNGKTYCILNCNLHRTLYLHYCDVLLFYNRIFVM